MAQQDFGLIGLAVMGQNLVLNIEEKGFSVAVFNRTAARTEEFMAGEAKGKKIVPTYTIEEFMASLKKPRRIMLMVKAGSPVDEFIQLVLPHMEKGDLLLDGGNSFFQDTIRRNKTLAEKGFLYIGTGVSGGEEGARHGPSIMPGGQQEAWDLVQPILTKIAAQVNGEPCCTYIGADGAGHYVKMVHNGIEYGDMQLISEAYFIMKSALGMSADEMHQVFAEWNRGPLDSYLIEITRDILARKDEETGKALVEVILDKAGQKGTGKWASQNALDLGVSVPTITEAVFARCISAVKEERVAASKVLSGPNPAYKGDKARFVEAIQQALYASKICSYAQGFALMKEARQGVQVGAELRGSRQDLAGRVHHSRPVPAPHHRGLSAQPETRQSHARSVLQGHSGKQPGAVAPRARHGDPARPAHSRRSPRRSPTSTPIDESRCRRT